MTALVARNLWRFYDGQAAVRGLDLAVERGSAYGFIGPNGSGKSTTLRMLATLDRPDAGRIWIDGQDAQRDPRAARRRLGFMPDPFALHDDLTVEDQLRLFAQLYDLPVRDRARAVDRALTLTRTAETRGKKCGQLSKGWRQRVLLAKTLVHDPPLLLLDEPASGLDPAARIEFREVVRALRDLGKAIVVSSHILTELADFCDSVGIIQHGRMLVSGKIDDILRRLDSSERIVIEVAGDAKPAEETLTRHAAVRAVQAAPPADGTTTWIVTVREPATPALRAALVRALVEAGVAVSGVEVAREDLEALYLKVSAGAKDQAAARAAALETALAPPDRLARGGPS